MLAGHLSNPASSFPTIRHVDNEVGNGPPPLPFHCRIIVQRAPHTLQLRLQSRSPTNIMQLLRLTGGDEFVVRSGDNQEPRRVARHGTGVVGESPQCGFAVPVAAQEGREVAVREPLLRVEREEHALDAREGRLQDDSRDRGCIDPVSRGVRRCCRRGHAGPDALAPEYQLRVGGVGGVSVVDPT